MCNKMLPFLLEDSTVVFLYHHQASFDLLSSREVKERSSTEHLEMICYLEAEIKSMGKSWYQLEKDAQDRRLWRETVDGLCQLLRSEGQTRGGGALPSNGLLGMCRWMGSHFHDSTDYNGVTFSSIFNRVTRMGSHFFSTLRVRKS